MQQKMLEKRQHKSTPEKRQMKGRIETMPLYLSHLPQRLNTSSAPDLASTLVDLGRRREGEPYYGWLLIFVLEATKQRLHDLSPQPNKIAPKKRIHPRPHISPSGTGPTARAQ